MSNTNTQPNIGNTLGDRYLIEEKLGEGGMSVVYRALDARNMNRQVAIKLILSQHNRLVRESAQLRLNREQEAALRIIHPNVVQVLDSGITENGELYLVQEYIQGESLDKLLKRKGQLDYDEILLIVTQIGAALEAAHSEGVVHRDLKPSNVMLQNLSGGGKQVKVIDFGIAKVQESIVEGKTDTGIVVGTPLYASPEQLQSFLPDPKMDLWAFAVMTYEMITGVLPFRASTVAAIFFNQVNGPLPMRNYRHDITNEVEAIIAKSLSYKIEDRYESIQSFCSPLIAALNRLLSGAPANESATNSRLSANAEVKKEDRLSDLTTVKLTPATRKNNFIVYALAALIALTVCISGFYFYKKSNQTATADKPAAGHESAASAQKTFELSYHLLIQDSRNKPFYGTDRDMYRTDDFFKILVSSSDAMHLYILNEGTDGNLVILFPTDSMNDGASSIEKDKEISIPSNTTKWFSFDKIEGEEKLLLVLSQQPVTAMEGIKQGAIKDPTKATEIRNWLKSQNSSPKQINDADVTKLASTVEPFVAHITLHHH